MNPQHRSSASFSRGMWVSFVLAGAIVTGLHADTAFDRLYVVLRNHGISFDTNAVTETAIEAAIRKIDPGARLIKVGQAPLPEPPSTVLKREEWAEGIGYLRIGGFFEEGRKEVLSCLREWAAEGRHGIILDLRGAGGHDLDAVDELAGFFLTAETNLYQIVNAAGEVLETRRARKNGGTSRPAVILIILLDGSTKGASELFAAVMQNAGGVLLIGSPTAGDSALREYIPLSDDKVLHIATRRLRLFNGENYNKGNGIVPDIPVSDTARRETMANRLTPRYDRTLSEKTQKDFQLMQRVSADPVLARAVDILLGLTALEYHESGKTTNSLHAARL